VLQSITEDSISIAAKCLPPFIFSRMYCMQCDWLLAWYCHLCSCDKVYCG